MNFSDKLKLLRKEKNLNQEEASRLIGIALSSLRKYEQVGKPDVPQLIKIKDFYKVSYDYLLNDNCNTREVNNLEIVDNLGITEQTVENIREFENKEFLEDLFTNKYSAELLRLLEEKNQTKFVNDYIINKFCKRLIKIKELNKPSNTMINTMNLLNDYIKKEKIQQSYWDFIMNNNYYNNFVNSIEYIINCWHNKKEIKGDNEILKLLDNETLIHISNNLLDYEKYCFASFSSVMDNFYDSYEENKVFKI